jgi:hypothetical protein
VAARRPSLAMRRLHQPGRRGAPDEWGEGFLAGHRPSLPGDYSGGNHPASKGNKGKPSKDKHWDEYVDPGASVGFFRCFLALALEHLKPTRLSTSGTLTADRRWWSRPGPSAGCWSTNRSSG